MATRRCRRLIEAGRVRLALADGASIPYAAASFDRAYTVHTIYFWDDPGRHLRELHRVLTENGRAVLGFHAKEEAVAAAFPASVYTFYTIDEVRELLRQAGFEAVEVNQSAVAFVTAHRRGHG